MSPLRKLRIVLGAICALFAGAAIAEATQGRWDIFLYWMVLAFLFAFQSYIGKGAYRAGYFNGRVELINQMAEGQARGMTGEQIMHAIMSSDLERAADKHWP